MSTPFLSGLAAILRGIPGIGSPDVIALDMENSALDLGPSGWDSLYGYGFIQMDRAIKLALPPTATPQAVIPARSAGQGQGIFVTFTPGPSFYTLTFTPSSTILPSKTPIITTYTPAPSETGQVDAQMNATPAFPIRPTLTSKSGIDWPVGCWGIVLILLGILLAWIINRRRGHSYTHSQHYKTR